VRPENDRLFWSFEKERIYKQRENSTRLMSGNGLYGMLLKQIFVLILVILGGLLAPVGGGSD
jgi:hypothetical protein